MKIEFDVKMTVSKLYDYMLYHTYHGMQGILGGMAGVLFIIGFVVTDPHKWLYLICGVVILLYLPVALLINARRQIKLQPAFQDALHYVLSDEGIEVQVGEQVDSQPWESVHKAVCTSKNLILYTSKNTASLFPRADLGEQEVAVIEMISTHMDPKKVNLRV
ncbi:MAG: YcxB family protein [Lachnospiraceae bacterium]|nr:YcxB family protein [Lachnospiraceae bacterium]